MCEKFEQALREIHKQKLVETAYRASLNKIAGLFDPNWRQADTADALCVRVKAALPSQIMTSTVAEVHDIVAILLVTDVKR